MTEYDLLVQGYGWVSPVSDGWVITGYINRQHWIKGSDVLCKQHWSYVSGTRSVPGSAVRTSKRWWKNNESLETTADWTRKGSVCNEKATPLGNCTDRRFWLNSLGKGRSHQESASLHIVRQTKSNRKSSLDTGWGQRVAGKKPIEITK